MNLIMVFIFSAFTAMVALLPQKSWLLSNKIPLHTDNGNFAQIIPFLKSMPDTEAKCLPAEVRRTQAGMLVPEYIGKKRFTDAETMLNNLQKDNLERQKKDDYYRVHIELGKTSRKPTDMTIAEKTTVEQVALSETEVSYNAKAVLHFWFNEKYDPVLETMSNNRMAQPGMCEKEIPVYIMDEAFSISGIYPNPNDGSMKMDYTLPENSRALLRIFDLTGRIVEHHIITGSGQLQLNNSDLNGVYFYEIMVNNKIITSEKFVVVK